MLGRPPSLRLSYVDCELPEDEEITFDVNGNPLVGCMAIQSSFIWKKLTLVKYRLSLEI